MKTGNQKPTFSVIGKYSYSLGDEVVEMFEEEFDIEIDAQLVVVENFQTKEAILEMLEGIL